MKYQMLYDQSIISDKTLSVSTELITNTTDTATEKGIGSKLKDRCSISLGIYMNYKNTTLWISTLECVPEKNANANTGSFGC